MSFNIHDSQNGPKFDGVGQALPEAKQAPANLFEAKLEYMEAFMKVFGYNSKNPQTHHSYEKIQSLKEQYSVSIKDPRDPDCGKIVSELNQELRKVNAFAVRKFLPEDLKDMKQEQLSEIIQTLVQERKQNPKLEINNLLSERDISKKDQPAWKSVNQAISKIRKVEEVCGLSETAQAISNEQKRYHSLPAQNKLSNLVSPPVSPLKKKKIDVQKAPANAVNESSRKSRHKSKQKKPSRNSIAGLAANLQKLERSMQKRGLLRDDKFFKMDTLVRRLNDIKAKGRKGTKDDRRELANDIRLLQKNVRKVDVQEGAKKDRSVKVPSKAVIDQLQMEVDNNDNIEEEEGYLFQNLEPVPHDTEKKMAKLEKLVEAFGDQNNLFGIDGLRAELDEAMTPMLDEIAMATVADKIQTVTNVVRLAKAFYDFEELNSNLQETVTNTCAALAMEQGGTNTLRALQNLISVMNYDPGQLLEIVRGICDSNVLARCAYQEEGCREEIDNLRDVILEAAKPNLADNSVAHAYQSDISFLLNRIALEAEELIEASENRAAYHDEIIKDFRDTFSYLVQSNYLEVQNSKSFGERVQDLVQFLNNENNYEALYSTKDKAEEVKQIVGAYLKECAERHMTSLESELRLAFRSGYGSDPDESGIQFLKNCASGQLNEKLAGEILANTTIYLEKRLREEATVSAFGGGADGQLAKHNGPLSTKIVDILVNAVLTSPTDKQGARVYGALFHALKSTTDCGAYNMGMNITAACDKSYVENAINAGYATTKKRRKMIEKLKGGYLDYYSGESNFSKLRQLTSENHVSLPISVALKDHTFAQDGNEGSAQLFETGKVAEKFFAASYPLPAVFPNYALLHHLEENPDRINDGKNWEAAKALKEPDGIGSGWPNRK